MNERTVRLHLFCSAKGGVGKSTLAVAAATLLAPTPGRRGVVLDVDLTGTSLADGLGLCGPRVQQLPGGRLDLTAPPLTDQWLTRQETEAARVARGEKLAEDAQWAPYGVPFLNDLLEFQRGDEGEDCRPEALLWRQPERPELGYLPSSSLRWDVTRALPWLEPQAQEAWVTRILELLFLLVQQLPELTDLVVDLPPGLFGFSEGMLRTLWLLANPDRLPEPLAARRPAEVTWRINPILVTSPDRNDLVAALEGFLQLRQYLPGLLPLVNRNTEPPRTIRQRLPEHLRALGLGERLEYVDALDASLGRLFRDEPLRLASDQATYLAQALRLELKP